MKQIIQNFKTGETILAELPTPKPGPGKVLIKTRASLVSVGTERMLVEFGKANFLQKARQQPDKVKQVFDKVKKDGLFETINTVYNKLDQPIALGYCNVGEVIALGEGVSSFSIGDRVASNGVHAEIISVPENLVANIPNNVSDEDATFTVIGSIALHGIRLIKPTYGETIVVFGLGIIGIIACQLLKANGCRVIGIDLMEEKRNLAKELNIEVINPLIDDNVKSITGKTNGIGTDAVLITASTKSNQVISDSAKMSRKRGRIVLIGVVGLNINRSEFYNKEISFQVSCSYGPGRYDNNYENKGIDYPISYVRWTEKRNFEVILNSLAKKKINVNKLISSRVKLEDYKTVYNNIKSKAMLGSILTFPKSKKVNSSEILTIKKITYKQKKCVVGIIGSGNYIKTTVLPKLKKNIDSIKYIASSNGLSSTNLAKKYGIPYSTTNYKIILEDKEVDTIIIATRHDTHSKIIIEGLKANKNIFVEKPLALNQTQLDSIISQLNITRNPSIMVGFNRRFSPHSIAIKKSLGLINAPINIVATMNAGFISEDHWVHDMDIGGGRIIGEACHIIDLCVFLTGSLVQSVCANSLGSLTNLKTDNVSLLVKFKNGSNAVINYFSNGSKSYSKEKLEVFSKDQIWILDDFKKTTYYGDQRFKTIKTKLDKGQNYQFNNYFENVRSGSDKMISLEQLINVSRTTFSIIESLKLKKWINI